MSIRKSSITALGAAVLVLPFVVGLAAPAQAATSPAGAYADTYGLLVDTTLLAGNVPLNIPPQAPAASSCPTPGGTKSAQVLGVGTPAAARADVITDTATTDCAKTSATGTSQTAGVIALDGTPAAITAEVIKATTTTSCASKPTGSAKVVGLKIGGQSIDLPVNPAPNTKVLDPVLSQLGLTVIVNEQHPASLGRGLVVNGLHVIASGSGALPIGGSVIRGDIVVSHAVSGVVCPGGPGSDNGGLPKPDISFFKSASPSLAHKGDAVTYTAVVTNQSSTACEVLRFVDHIAPAFDLVSSAGPLGTALAKPAPARTDGGVDAVLHPTGVTIAPGKSVTQTFTVTVKSDATPGTYYDTLEIYCGPNGNFVSGPLAPVTIPGDGVPATEPANNVAGSTGGHDLAPTGLPVGIPVVALLALAAAAGTRRALLHRG